MARSSIAENLKGAAASLKKPGKARQPFEGERPRPAQIRLADIDPDPSQPRVDPGDVKKLAESIKDHGLLQPLIVSPNGTRRFQIIAGGRRYTACKQAGLDVIPCIVRSVKDQQRLEIQLVENLQRKDLDPFEEAAAYERLRNEFGLKQEQIAKRAGKSRPHVAKMLAIHQIPLVIREKCSSSNISLDDLYAIANRKSEKEMLQYLRLVQNGASFVEKRRQQRPQEGSPPQKTKIKPKMKFHTQYDAIVIVQSLTIAELTKQRQITALKEALEEALRNTS